MRALVIGHLSTVGDIESLEFVRDILNEERIAFDIAPYNQKFVAFIAGSLPIAAVNAADYTHLIAVCGPFWPAFLARHGVDLDRFAHCTRVGMNLTMVLPVEQWNPFDVLLERDSTRRTRPDATFLRDTSQVPVAGLCTIARQREYGVRQRHGEALALFRQLIAERGLATINIDTRWPKRRNDGGLGSPAEVISIISRSDMLLTNRLHGMVYALKAGVPALALDPVLGGDKITAQAKVLGWPAASSVESASPDWLNRTLDWCLSAEGRAAAQDVAGKARAQLHDLPGALRSALHEQFVPRPVPKPPPDSIGFARRLASALRLKR